MQKELKSFFALLESLRSSFRSWTSQIKEILALQVTPFFPNEGDLPHRSLSLSFVKDTDSPVPTDLDEVGNENISQEYLKIQQDIVSGRLLCSKEEAATLAAVQLRLEAWPEENLELIEGNFAPSLSKTLRFA